MGSIASTTTSLRGRALTLALLTAALLALAAFAVPELAHATDWV